MNTLELIKDSCLFGGTVPNERVEEVRTFLDSIDKECDVTPHFFVALVYQNKEYTMLRTLVVESENKHEALGNAIEYFSEETKGYGLVMKTVTSPNEE